MRTIDIVIVTYNSSNEILQCIQKSYSSKYNYIIIDNASTDNTVEVLDNIRYNNVIKILNSKNIGLAAANNQAIESVMSPYILILNPDTIIDSDSIDKMIKFLDENISVGIVGPATFDNKSYAKDNRVYGESFGNYFNISDIFYHILIPESLKWRKYSSTNLKPFKTDWISGHCLLIRTSIFKQISGYDPNYFLSICDVVDLCRRTCLIGNEVYFLPYVKCIHLGSRSSVKTSVKPLALFKTIQGYLYYWSKWKSPSQAYLLLFLVLINHLIKLLMFSIISIFFKSYRGKNLPHLYCIKKLIIERIPSTNMFL